MVFHYALSYSKDEGLQNGVDNKIKQCFRPDMNMKRMNKLPRESVLPTFDPEELITPIGKLIQQDKYLSS
ncbi:ANM_collapsed_G0031290.mRNA.1.CDS.1 [Saccharomyces cerevisiae]|nr:ANM_collapsed_G0031290.mRNA.1.CDS.1 [Saccharomyces cerevisiae]